MTNDNRQPAGTPVGGQFASGARPAASVQLSPWPEPTPRDPAHSLRVERAKEDAEAARRVMDEARHDLQVALKAQMALELAEEFPGAKLVHWEVRTAFAERSIRVNGLEAADGTDIDLELDMDARSAVQRIVREHARDLDWIVFKPGAPMTFDIADALNEWDPAPQAIDWDTPTADPAAADGQPPRLINYDATGDGPPPSIFA